MLNATRNPTALLALSARAITAVAATALLLAAAPAFAQGTTLAGPARGQKADGSNSTQPSAASGANGGAMTKSGGSMMKGGSTGGTATGQQ